MWVTTYMLNADGGADAAVEARVLKG